MTRFFALQHAESGASRRDFFTFWNGIFKWSCFLTLIITLSFLCQNSSSHCLRCAVSAAVWRARGPGLQQKLVLSNHPDWDKLTAQSCKCANPSCTVQTSAYTVVKHIPDVRKICPSDGLFPNFWQKCVHVRGGNGEK